MNVLITGGTGSFGKAFVKHLLTSSPAERICIFSRDEWKQAQMRQTFNDDPRLRYFIGDVRDKDRLTRAMLGVDLVIHAAALKRVETGEYNPDELCKTNIVGAMNVIEAAHIAHVHSVVALSTDKATAPCNAYGTSKLMAEKLFLAANNVYGCGPNYAVTRYGNVAGSTGSVIPIWRKAHAERKRIQVTDPEATRFWMSLQQAVELVSWAAGHRALIVPELPAYRLADLMEAMDLVGDLEFVGMRPGEKLHESMVSENEFQNFYLAEDQQRYWSTQPQVDYPMAKPMRSDLARRMSVDELREKLREV